eukprot:TRINITY_DN3780_c0_g2_i4.p1 TRINITY_DN3780_c0_g2~~TRINITY_DN3780_c0_g2_i4.p1  ORF type:complete len:343 (+),score=60.03 TRINITY_DN3780_c0_g2_i4:220-1248(+)
MSRINTINDFDSEKGTISAQSGANISNIRMNTINKGWDMRIWAHNIDDISPTIGGFLSASPYGIGSIQYGKNNLYGNIANIDIMTVEENPKILTLESNDLGGIIGSYGTSAIITSVKLNLTPSNSWREMILTFQDENDAIDFGEIVTQYPSVDTREICYIAPHTIKRKKSLPKDKALVLLSVAANSADSIYDICEKYKGEIFEATNYVFEEEEKHYSLSHWLGILMYREKYSTPFFVEYSSIENMKRICKDYQQKQGSSLSIQYHFVNSNDGIKGVALLVDSEQNYEYLREIHLVHNEKLNRFDAIDPSPNDLILFQESKNRFDIHNLLNPGKVLTLGSKCI